MKLHFDSLELTNFKSIQDTFVWELDREPGLYFLTGENVVNPRMGANGVGKSTLLDGLCWTLYGVTLRGLKAGNVRTWGSSDVVSGKVHFRLDGVGHTISRIWPNTVLAIGDQKVSQEEVDDLLRMSCGMFQWTIIHGQFSRAFLDLKPAERETLLSEALNLESWLARSRRVKTLADDVKAERVEIDKSLSRLLGAIEAKEEQDDAPLRKEWARAKKRRLASVKLRVDSAKGRIDKLDSEKKLIEESLSDSDETEASILEEFQSVRNESNQVQSGLDKLGERITEVKTRIGVLADQIRVIVDSDICPVCGQDIVGDHRSSELAKLRDRRSRLGDQVKDLQAEHDDLSLVLRRQSESLRRLNKKFDKVKDLRLRLSADTRAIQRERKAIHEQYVGDLKDLRKIEQESNPYNKHREQRAVELRKMKARVKELELDIQECDVEIADATYWVKGFKEVRLFTLARVLNELQASVNDSIAQLGLDGWELEFRTDQITQSVNAKGRKGLFVYVRSPGNSKVVPWEAWCGGETQRLRIAGDIGLSSLLLARRGVEVNFEAWDEPSAWLSAQGIDELLDRLYYRAKEERKQVWLIDHRSLNYGGFAGELRLCKDGQGTWADEG